MNAACRLTALALCGLVFGAPGCSRSRPREQFTRQPVFPVQGQLAVNGKPAVGASITFYPVPFDGWTGPIPSATVDEAGKFDGWTYDPSDGVPAGHYVLLVTWPEPDDEEKKSDRLQGRFNNPDRSKLKTQIKPQSNILPPINLR